ncbi:unnamed protein product [Closterium sp. Naga37s-1]|nr:unnamed protein product [Closterium sp. Naga37s-1]
MGGCSNGKASLQVLLDLQQAWRRNFSGWVAGGDCSLAHVVRREFRRGAQQNRGAIELCPRLPTRMTLCAR